MSKHDKAHQHKKDKPAEHEDDLPQVVEIDVPQEVEQSEVTSEPLLEKLNQLEERLLRQAAEAENARKRSLREMEDAKKYAISGFVADLIESIENLYRAIDLMDKSEAPAEGSTKGIYDGIRLTRDNILKTLAKHGVQRIYPTNQPFDHNLHQAIGQAERDGADANTVVEVVQAGYTLNDRLVRPALVMVGK